MSATHAVHPGTASNAVFRDRLNSDYHELALQGFMLIVLAHWAEHLLQAIGEREGLREDPGIVDGNGRRPGEQLPEFGSARTESVLVVGVHGDGADHVVAHHQRQRERAVHAEPTGPWAEPGPQLLTAQRSGTHRAPFQGGRDARTLV